MCSYGSLDEMLGTIRKMRNEVPEFNPDDAQSKEKIEQYHGMLHTLTLAIQQEVGFETYAQAIKFIDQEILNMANLEVAQ